MHKHTKNKNKIWNVISSSPSHKNTTVFTFLYFFTGCTFLFVYIQLSGLSVVFQKNSDLTFNTFPQISSSYDISSFPGCFRVPGCFSVVVMIFTQHLINSLFPLPSSSLPFLLLSPLLSPLCTLKSHRRK